MTYTGPRPGGNIFSRMKLWNKYEPEITKREAAEVLGKDAPPMSATHETPAAVPHGLSPAKRKAAIAAALKDEAPGVRATHAATVTDAAADAGTKASVAGSATAAATATHHHHATTEAEHLAAAGKPMPPGMRKPESWFDRAFSSPEFKKHMEALSRHPTAMTGADTGTTRAGMRSDRAAEKKIWGNPVWGPAFLGVGAALLMYNVIHYYSPPEVLDDAERKRRRIERLEELQQEIMFY
jgi:hypothetical protein